MNAKVKVVCAGLAAMLFGAYAWSCSGDYLIWSPRSSTAEPLFRFIEGKKMGFIDQTGKVVVPPVIPHERGNSGDEFHDGLVNVGLVKGLYFDTNGKKAIQKQFYFGYEFSEGLAAVEETERGPWGYIDTKGNYAIAPRFSEGGLNSVSSFQDGVARIEIGGMVGYIDHSGEFTIQPTLLDGASFYEGLVRVVMEGPCYQTDGDFCPSSRILPEGGKISSLSQTCKYTFIDKAGGVISADRYDYASHFSEGLAAVRVGQLWGYIDKSGSMVIPPRFKRAADFSDGLAVVTEDTLLGYIDRQGKFVVPQRFVSAQPFVDGLAAVEDQPSEYVYINHTGQQAFPGTFSVASSFFKGLANVRFPLQTYNLWVGLFGYIDKTGTVVFRYEIK